MPNRFSPLFSHEISTKAFSCLLALCFFLTSCATGHHYYDRDQDGTRYYETMNGKTIQVTADGVVFGSNGQQLGEVQKMGDDWDLSAYEVQPSYSRCIDLFDWDESVPCWGYGLQIPIFLVAIPAGLAVVGAGLVTAFYCGGGCSFSSAEPPSYSQARRNKGPARDQGGPFMKGAPSVGSDNWGSPLRADVVAQPQVPIAPASTAPNDFIEGNYWALIIGIDKYPNLDKDKQLVVARKDAEAVAKVLKDQYGFSRKRMIELYDDAASRKGIIRAFASLKRRLTDKDSLFIYYAGSGDYENTAKKDENRSDGMGYWIPADGQMDDPSTFIFNSQVSDYMASMVARHIYAVVDSTFSRSLMGRTRALCCGGDWVIKSLHQSKSRWVLTSGGLYPVSDVDDKSKSGHSVFAWHFMKVLERNTSPYVLPKEIGEIVAERVSNEVKGQLPRGAAVVGTGDEGGQFVFRLQKKTQKRIPGVVESPPVEATLLPFQASKEKDLAPVSTIPAGEFVMGSKLGEGQPDESPQRKVYLDAYTIDKYEVTVAQYADYLKKSGAEPPDYWERANQKEDGNRPVVGVDWLDADEYCRFYGKRLPTEAQWEKAARGTDGRKYPWGNEQPEDFLAFANFGYGVSFRYSKSLAPVGSYEAGKSPYGVYDMVGNVWEWVLDWYRKDYYQVASPKNPAGPDDGDYVVIRGGSWALRPGIARSAGRMYLSPNTRSNSLGFRCAGEAR